LSVSRTLADDVGQLRPRGAALNGSRAFAIVGSRGYPSTYGGFETFVRRLAPYLLERGHEVTVYCRDGKPGVEMRDGIRCISTRGMNSNSLSTLSYGFTSSRHARTHGYDAALVLNVANGYFLRYLRAAGIPTAVNVDGLEWERGKWNRLGKAVFWRGAQLTARDATEIVVDSREIGRVWRDKLGRTGRYIPYGADVVENVGADKLQARGINPGSYALVVARLVPENNVDLFLDALDRVDRAVPAVVVGTASSAVPLVSRLQARAGTHRDFHWTGHVDDQAFLSQLWAHCALYFHGHAAGGTNPGLLQALGHGAPTLALDTPFNAEVVNSAEQRVPHDAMQIAARMQELLDNPARQRQFAAQGRRTITEHFGWTSVLGEYHDLLVSLADTARLRVRPELAGAGDNAHDAPPPPRVLPPVVESEAAGHDRRRHG
jgi:glycosyltransferase involved in cell wall biosynthesis